jgi:hypothetical protein
MTPMDVADAISELLMPTDEPKDVEKVAYLKSIAYKLEITELEDEDVRMQLFSMSGACIEIRVKRGKAI